MRRRLLAFLFPIFLALPAMAGETPLSLPAPPGALRGTLLSPNLKPGTPAVLMLAGSGPTDRDGNSPAGVRANTYKLLAEGLAADGITSLRVDKRGIAQSKDAMSAENDLRFQTYADDANNWAAELRKRIGAPCVWLLGHSEGALVAEVASQKGAGICGLILISGAGRRADDLIRIQVAANPANPPAIVRQVDDILKSLDQGKAVSEVPPYLDALFRPSAQPYLMSWLPLDPATLLANTKLPVLILQGNSDLQVSVEDAQLLAAADPGAKLIVLPGVNHILKMAPMDRTANFATYSDPALPLAPGVANAIVQFIREHGI